MILEEHAYRTLVVSSSAKLTDALRPMLVSAHCDPITTAESISQAKRLTMENQYDFVIVNAPLPDDFGTKFALDVSDGKSTVCLLLVRAEAYEQIRPKAIAHGVFVLSRPTSAAVMAHALDFLTSARERLRRLEKKTVSIEEKMEEIRLVNRAKWLLIENLKMTEPDAHRYIEKEAMNTCVSKREIAESIIETYV
ncbi:MAG: ANTAR domain-containing protein [Clostridia bacterium]|nr:ANTAR domain-containing protein [Clostridia bacterium]